MKKLLLALVAFAFCGAAHAQFVISPGINYVSVKTEATTPATVSAEGDGLGIDMRLGYIFPMGFYIGGMYSYLSGSFAFAPSLGSDAKDSGSLLGPTIGYYNPMGFNMLFTYHLMGDSKSELNGVTATFKGASGFQFDIGWNFPITSVFGLGPQITYKSIEYGKVDTGTEVTTDYKYTTIDPYLAFWFMF